MKLIKICLGVLAVMWGSIIGLICFAVAALFFYIAYVVAVS